MPPPARVTLTAAFLSVAIAATDVYAQGTAGKIQGRVVSAAGQPIASVQVTVDGTNLGNISNDDGFYFINQVPAGLHTVRAQSIGFRTVLTSEQRVLAGQLTNPINQYMVLEAEKRDGDGVFTVAEQRHMINDYYDLLLGPQYFRESNRYLRLGFELVF